MMNIKNKIICCSPEKERLIPSLRNESGAALIVALLLMVVMLSLIPVATQFTSGDMDRTQNFKDDRQLFYLAEAGLEHAKALTSQSTLDAILAGPDGDPTNALDNGTFGSGTLFTWTDGNVYDKVPFNGNTYYIRAYDNDDGDGDFTNDSDSIVTLASVGSLVDGNTTTVEALVYNPPGGAQNAVTVNGNMTIAGDPTINGSCGNVHTNANLTTPGHPSISGTVTASGTSDMGPGGDPNVPIPDLTLTDFKQYANYVLASDGNVYDSTGTFVSNSPWYGWQYNSGQQQWRQTQNSTIDASLYVEGDVMIAGNPGSQSVPWETTIVATGYINVAGNPFIKNKKNLSDPEDIQNLFLVAGTDLSFRGNPSHTIEGLMYAKEQIEIDGNPNIVGAVMALDNPSVENLVTQSEIFGNPTITYGCGLTVPGMTANIQIVSWKEL